MKMIRKEIDLVVRSVEAVGWECVSVGQFMYSINMEFVRATANPHPSITFCTGHTGAADANTKPASATTNDVDTASELHTHQNKHRCNTERLPSRARCRRRSGARS